MATVTANVSNLIRPNEASANADPVTFANGDTVLVPFTGNKNLIVAINPTGTGTITVSAGDGIAGTNDLEFAITNGKATFIQLDSSSFEQLSGTNKGKAVLTPTAGGKITAVNGL